MKWMLLSLPLILAGCGDAHDHSGHSHGAHAAPPAADKAKDPVCGMEIAKAGARKAEFDAADIHFCSEACEKKFQAEPAKYVKACSCSKTMPDCDCGHCAGKRIPCDCH